MSEEKNSGSSKFWLGALLGTAAGAIAGILLAPKSGKETRADIKNAAGEAGKKVSEAGEKVANEARSRVSKISNRFSKKKPEEPKRLTAGKVLEEPKDEE